MSCGVVLISVQEPVAARRYQGWLRVTIGGYRIWQVCDPPREPYVLYVVRRGEAERGYIIQ